MCKTAHSALYSIAHDNNLHIGLSPSNGLCVLGVQTVPQQTHVFFIEHLFAQNSNIYIFALDYPPILSIQALNP